MAGKLGSINILMGLDAREFIDGLGKSEYEAQKFARRFDSEMRNMQRSAREVTASVERVRNSLARLTVGFVGAFGVREVIRAADSYGQMSSRIRAATKDTAEFNQVQQQLLSTSNRTYKSFDDAAELFVRTRGALQQLGADAKDTADFVSTIQFGLTLDSADSQKTKSVIDALSKSLLQGKLSAEQLNTVIAASPTLFQALADSIAGGSLQVLQQMVRDGKVTADQLLKITNQAEKLGKAVNQMPTSVGDAFVKLQNNVTQFIGSQDQATGATARLVKVVDYAADHVKELAEAFRLFGAFRGLRSGLNFGADIVQQYSSLRDLNRERANQAKAALEAARREKALADINVGIARTTSALTGNMDALTKAKERAAKASTALASAEQVVAKANRALAITGKAVLGVLGGWPGVIALGATALLALFSTIGNDGEKAAEVNDRLRESTDKYAESIRNLSQAQRDQDAVQLDKAIAQKQQEIGELTPFGDGFSQRTLLGAGTAVASEVQSVIEQIRQISEEAKNSNTTYAEVEDAINKVLQKHKEYNAEMGNSGPVIDKANAAIINYANSVLDGSKALSDLNAKQLANREASEQAAQGHEGTADAMQVSTQAAIDYTDELAEQARQAGLSAAAIAELKVIAAEGTAEQAKLAGDLVRAGEEQKQNFDALREAIKNKDAAAEAAAKRAIAATYDHIDALRREQVEAAKMLAIYGELRNKGIPKTSDEGKKAVEEGRKEAGERFDDGLKREAEVRAKSIRDFERNVRASLARVASRSSAPRVRRSSGGGSSAKEQESELQRLVKQLKEQQATLGLTTLEQQNYRIEQMKGTQELKTQAKEIAANIAQRKELIETQKAQVQLQNQLEDFRSKQRADIDTASMPEYAAKQYKERLEVVEDYNNKVRDLEQNQLAEGTRISEEAKNIRLKHLEELRDGRLAIIAETQAAEQKMRLDAGAAITKQLQDLAYSASDAYSQLQQFTTNVFDSLTDGFTEFVLTGKASFKDMVDSMLKDLMRFAVRFAVFGPIARGLSGITGSIGSMPNILRFSGGGWVTGPGTTTSDSIPAMLSRDEAVLNARETAALGGKAGFERLRKAIAQYGATTPNMMAVVMPSSRHNVQSFANGGYVTPQMVRNAQQAPSAPNVQIINNSSQPIQARQKSYDPRTGILQVVVEDIKRNGDVLRAIRGAM